MGLFKMKNSYSADIYRNLDKVERLWSTSLFDLFRNIKNFVSTYEYKWPVGNFRIDVYKGKEREHIGKYITYESQNHKELVRQPIMKIIYVDESGNEVN